MAKIFHLAFSHFLFDFLFPPNLVMISRVYLALIPFKYSAVFRAGEQMQPNIEVRVQKVLKLCNLVNYIEIHISAIYSRLFINI